jgi:large subunit ribosomal protein L4
MTTKTTTKVVAPIKRKGINTKSTAPRLRSRKPKVAVAKAPKKEVVAKVLEAQVFNMEGKKLSVMALPVEIFGAPWRSDLVHQVSTGMQANARQNRAHTKDRAEVSGGGKKPWKQKGTGQARHGSSRSPIWRHGGITFGPRNERDYSEKINKKMRLQALVSVLSRKFKDGELILVDKFTFTAPKTATAKTALVALGKGADAVGLVAKKKNAALLAMSSYDVNMLKSFKNIGNVMTEEVRNINPLEVMSKKYLIIENPEVAFKTLLARVKNA